MKNLFQRYPSLASKIPYHALGEFPTPITGPVSVGPHQIWIKRDDLSGKIHGGNKVRKLELVLGEALQKNVSSLVVVGALGSNWCVASSIYGKQAGFSVKALLFPQPETSFSRKNFSFLQQEASEIQEISSPLLVPFILWKEKKKKKSLLLAPGGTSPLSSLGYVNAALELSAQIEEGKMPIPDQIWLPLGTGGTTAGLLVGLSLCGLPSTLVGVRVIDRVLANRWRVLLMARKIEKLLENLGGEERMGRSRNHFHIVHSAFGKGYGHPTSGGEKAIHFFLQNKISLEPTYTGKTASALLSSLTRASRPLKILFWNTYNSIPLEL